MTGEKKPGRPGRPAGTHSDNPRTLTKRQRWTPDEWEEVENSASSINETPSDFVRAATLARCRKKTR